MTGGTVSKIRLHDHIRYLSDGLNVVFPLNLRNPNPKIGILLLMCQPLGLLVLSAPLSVADSVQVFPVGHRNAQILPGDSTPR